MLLDNLSQYLVQFTARLEEKNIVNSDTATKIRKYVRAEETPAHWQFFLIFGAILGAITFSAGVYAIVSHNWYDFPVWLRGILSFVPAVGGLYFYYLMLTKHKNSTAWIEASSLFLMLMIGASIAIASQIYHLGGDYEDFIFTMLLFTIPLFYISKASGIAFFYLALALVYLALDVRITISDDSFLDFGTNSIWFWIFVLAMLPHYYLTLRRDKKIQGLRFMFLILVLYIFIYWALIASIDSNRLLWSVVYNVGFYLYAKRYMGDHFWFLSRILSWLPQITIAFTLLSISNRFIMFSVFRFDSFVEMDDWTGRQWYYFVLLLVVMAGIYYNYFKSKDHYTNCNQLIVFAPGFIVVLMLLDFAVDWWWLKSILINVYLFLIAVVTMVNASEEGRFVKLFAGLLLIALLVGIRYFDTSWGFISKGLLFMALGGMFFLINMFVKEKVDQIERNKKRTNGK